MIRRSTTLPISLAAGAAVLVLTAGPALAATTYTVKAGTKTSGTTAYTAATTGAGQQIAFNDVTTGTALGCDSGTAKGAVNLGKSLSGTGLGTITGTTWTACKGPLGLALTVTQQGTWAINATGATASNKTPGTISGVTALVKDTTGGSSCTFTVTGTVKAKVTTTPSKQQLAIAPAGSTLKVSGVTGCFGLVNNGDKANFKATYNVVAADGKLVITNP